MLRSFRASAEARKNFRQNQARGLEHPKAAPPSAFESRRAVYKLPADAQLAVHEYTQCVKANCTKCNGLRQDAQIAVRNTTKFTNNPVAEPGVFTSSKSGEAPRHIGLPKSNNASAIAIAEMKRENDVNPANNPNDGTIVRGGRRAVRVGARPSALGLIRGRTATTLEDGLFTSTHAEKSSSMQANDAGEGFNAAKVRPRWNYQDAPTYGVKRVSKPVTSNDIHGFDPVVPRDSGVEEVINDRLTRERFTSQVYRGNY